GRRDFPLLRPPPGGWSFHFFQRIRKVGAPNAQVNIEVVQRAADTDPEAFFRKHYPDLHRYISGSTGLPQADVDDLVQETLVQAWRDRAQFGNASAPSTWLLSIARNRVRDLLRRHKVRRDTDRVLRALGRMQVEEVAPDLLESAELGARVREVLNALPP